VTAALLSPYRLGPFELATRVCMAPLTRCRAGAGRAPTALNAEYYAQRAHPTDGAALIVSEATQIDPGGIGYQRTPGIHSAEQIAGWRLVTDAVHARGGRIVAQLWHVGRFSHSSWAGLRPVSSSEIALPIEVWTASGAKGPAETPRALALEEIPIVIGQYRHAARCALEAGFDGVELHGANGYLVDQFLRDGVNRRTDAYGGPARNRVRFLREVVEALIEVWGPDRVGVRLSTPNTPTIFDADPLTTFSTAAEALNDYPLLYLHLLEGPPGTRWGPSEGESAIAPAIRRIFRGAFMVNGGYTRESGERVVAEGGADLVAYGTPFIANPDLTRRYRLGAPLAEADPTTFYTEGPRGYTDYPPLAASAIEA
jgi:N-ethylmaleimide reductase